MTVYLLRHAVAVRRPQWRGDDRDRPLTGGGHRQAQRLVRFLRDAQLDRLVTSPALRCRQSLEPLAAQRGLRLETDARLEEGGDVEAAIGLLRELGDADAVLSSHGDLIPALVERLCARAGRGREPVLCEKGSLWILEGPPHAPEAATYVPPPAKRKQPLEGADPEGRDLGEADLAPLERDKRRVAVLDLGSTSFHLLVADATATGEIRRVLREREMLRLGALITSHGVIPEDVCARSVEAARRLRDHADEAAATTLLPVATAALRDAGNGGELAGRLGEVLGAPVEILSGAEEARLTFGAIQARLAPEPGPRLGLDLGGGSLELVLGEEDRVIWTESYRLGVARLHRELSAPDRLDEAARRALHERVSRSLAPARRALRRARLVACAATGGTVAALARRIATRRTTWPTRDVGQLFVPRAELAGVAAELASLPHAERIALPGMARQRADLLPTGAIVLEAALDALGLAGFVVSDWGLREGVILRWLGLTPPAA